MFTFKQLEAFHSIAHLGGLRQAADRLGATESAISKRLHELEAVLRCEVFSRESRALELTSMGTRLLPLADQLLLERNRFLAEARQGDPEPRVLRIGMTELIAALYLPHLVDRFHRDLPAMSLSPTIGLTDDLIGQLKRRELDVLIVPRIPELPGDMQSEPLFVSNTSWFAAPSMVSPGQPIGIDRLARMPIIMQPSPSLQHQNVVRWFRQMGYEIGNIIVCNNLAGLKDLAKAGFGAAPLPELYCTEEVVAGRLIRFQLPVSLPGLYYATVYPTAATIPDLPVVCAAIQQICGGGICP